MNINPIIRRLVNRLHVSTSYLDAIRAVVARLEGGRTSFVKMPRDTRRSLLRQVVFAHWESRDLALWIDHRAVEIKPDCIETRKAALAPV